MFLNAEPFFSVISFYRLLWIGGRFGGHKTSLSYMIAKKYLDQGYRLISNNRSVWADDPKNVDLLPETHLLKSVVILDEGGLYFNTSKQVQMIASYCRKMDVIYIMPSFWPPSRTAQVLTCQPIFSLRSAGIPAICYKWRAKIGSFEDKGMFFWVFPQEIYGIYSTKDPGDVAADIIAYLVEKTEQYRIFEGRTNKISFMETDSGGDLFADAADQMAEVADQLAAIPFRKGRRR